MCPITEIKAEGEPADDGGRGGGNDGWSFGLCFHRQTVAPTHYYVGCLPSHLILLQDTPRDRTAHRSAQLAAPFRQPSFVTPPTHARRAESTALAGKGDQTALAATLALQMGEASTEQTAVQVTRKLLADEARQRDRDRAVI